MPDISHDTFPLRSRDQSSVAAVVLICLFMMAAYGLRHRERLIDIDQAEPLSADFRVDVNQSSWPELAQLPGIGETLARRIVESRERDGPFEKPQDLQRVHGLGPKSLSRIRRFLLPM